MFNVSRLAKNLIIPRTTLNYKRKDKEKMIDEFEAGHNAEKKRKRQHGLNGADEPLFKCFRSARDYRWQRKASLKALKIFHSL